jgi:hypothetical protein
LISIPTATSMKTGFLQNMTNLLDGAGMKMRQHPDQAIADL